MRPRWSRPMRLALVLSLAAVVVFGGRWVLHKVYPLEYRALVVRRAQEYELDPYLVAAVIRTESRFRPRATSKEGASGLMQIMPTTAQWAAGQLEIPYSPELLFDPDYNVRLGCWYLSELRREFGGDMVLALAAYNAGRGNVAKWLRENQWTGEHTTLDQIPFWETRVYIARVLRDVQWYQFLYGDVEGR